MTRPFMRNCSPSASTAQGADKYTNVRVGINGRMDSLQAAVLLAKMEIFPEEIELRQVVAARYDQLLAGAVQIPKILEGNVSAWAQYSIRASAP